MYESDVNSQMNLLKIIEKKIFYSKIKILEINEILDCDGVFNKDKEFQNLSQIDFFFENSDENKINQNIERLKNYIDCLKYDKKLIQENIKVFNKEKNSVLQKIKNKNINLHRMLVSSFTNNLVLKENIRLMLIEYFNKFNTVDNNYISSKEYQSLNNKSNEEILKILLILPLRNELKFQNIKAFYYKLFILVKEKFEIKIKYMNNKILQNTQKIQFLITCIINSLNEIIRTHSCKKNVVLSNSYKIIIDNQNYDSFYENFIIYIKDFLINSRNENINDFLDKNNILIDREYICNLSYLLKKENDYNIKNTITHDIEIKQFKESIKYFKINIVKNFQKKRKKEILLK